MRELNLKKGGSVSSLSYTRIAKGKAKTTGKWSVYAEERKEGEKLKISVSQFDIGSYAICSLSPLYDEVPSVSENGVPETPTLNHRQIPWRNRVVSLKRLSSISYRLTGGICHAGEKTDRWTDKNSD